MEHYLERVSVSSNYDHFGDTSVEGFGGFVGALLDLLERCALGDQVVYFGGKVFSGKGSGSFRDFLTKGRLTIC